MKNFKGFMKKMVAGLLATTVICTTCITADAKPYSPIREEAYTSADEIAEICWSTYNKGQYGPIFIVKGELTENGKTDDIYLIALCGTELIEGQATGILQDLYVGFQREDNPYTKNVVKAIKEEIPAGSNLMITGHSLGGMVSQMVAANKEVKANYNVLHTLTFGSPVIKPNEREGIVRRLGDKSDFVPYLSVTLDLTRQIFGLNREDGGYQTKLLWGFKQGWNAHEGSYIRKDVWGEYDATGLKGGNATVKLDPSTLIYKQSPVSWEQMINMYSNK